MGEWIGKHWVEILAVIGGLHAIAKVVVSWTPTEKDNRFLAWVEKIFRTIGLQPKGNG